MIRSLALIFALTATAAHADPAQVDGVVLQERSGTWTVSVTISHGDTGWDDYADGWRIETPAGEILGTRVLHHPHVEEQPFTRSLAGVEIAQDVAEIVVRTRTNVTGWAEGVSDPIEVPDGI
jgi:hypothetical protein